LAGNSTAIWLVLEFNPPLSASYPERVYVAFNSMYIYGQRWPDIWSHNSQNWLATSSRTYAYTGLSSAIVARDYWAYSVWPESYRPYNDTAPYIRAAAYVTITTQAGATLTPYPPMRPYISYAYIPTDGYAYTRLKYICLATETGAWGLPEYVDLFVARGNANPILDAAVSIGGAIINTVGNVITAATLVSTVFGLPYTGILTTAGFITWGLGLFTQMVSTNQGSCGPSGYLGEYYSAASNDWILSASLGVAIGQAPVVSGDFKHYISLYVRDSYTSTLSIYPGNGILTNFFTYVGFSSSSYFSGPAEPYGGIGWVRYYIPIR
jgi:hypothetical protein